MNTPSIYKRVLGAALSCFGMLAGCTYTGGQLLYFLGLGRGEKVPAQFQLTQGPILILIDDPAERIDWPPTTRHLFDELSQELLRNKAASKIVPLETLDSLRSSIPDFNKRGCREIGREAGAEQVLWIEVKDFFAQVQIEDALTASYFNVTVKVINALEEESRSRVRLWPVSPAGQPVSASLTGSEAQIAETRDGITKELAQRLAVDIAKLFYEYRLGDFERPQ